MPPQKHAKMHPEVLKFSSRSIHVPTTGTLGTISNPPTVKDLAKYQSAPHSYFSELTPVGKRYLRHHRNLGPAKKCYNRVQSSYAGYCTHCGGDGSGGDFSRRVAPLRARDAIAVSHRPRRRNREPLAAFRP